MSRLRLAGAFLLTALFAQGCLDARSGKPEDRAPSLSSPKSKKQRDEKPDSSDDGDDADTTVVMSSDW